MRGGVERYTKKHITRKNNWLRKSIIKITIGYLGFSTTSRIVVGISPATARDGGSASHAGAIACPPSAG